MRIYFSLAIISLAVACQPVQKETADIIYEHGVIWTGDSLQPQASAIGIRGNQICYIGDEPAQIKDEHTKVIDLKGAFVVPGLIDNHTHFLNAGYNLSGVQLRNAASPGEFIAILSAYCRQHPDDRWILGGDWDHENWGGDLPNRKWIDSVTGNHPLFVSRYDGHMAFANSKALQLAGVNPATPVPEGGSIVKDATGEPTGVLKDEAMGLVNRVIPAPSARELDEYFETALQFAVSHGVTQVHDMGSYGGWLDRETYARAKQEKRLQLRIYSFAELSSWKKLDSFCKKNGKGDDMLRWGGLKGFVDGSLGSTTAWFYQPYLDAPGSTGLQVTDSLLLKQWVLAADSAGLQIAVHAIGDRANDFILDIFRDAGQKDPGRDRRFRIEHAQHLSPSAISRFAQMGVIPSMQPYHAIDDGRWASKRLDPDRLKGTYAFKSLLDKGARLTFGSDWPVAPATPLEGIYAAVTRRTLDEKNPAGWQPQEKISVEDALRCYTAHNAYAGFQENKLGILRSGMLADLVILDQNVLKMDPVAIRNTQVIATIIDGKEVYRQH